MIRSNLYEKTLYLKDIDFLINDVIYEYDLSKANASILRDAGFIGDDTYRDLCNMDRMQRQVTIGYWQRDLPRVAELLESGFIRARQLFFDQNDLEDNDILSIKKDAIFTLRKVNHQRVSEHLFFKEKNFYTSYFRILSQKKELYYSKHPFTGAEALDIKGINDESIPYHEHYMKEFLMVLFETVQIDILEAIDVLSRFISLYRQRRLDPGFYRTFNTDSKYFYFAKDGTYEVFSASELYNPNDVQYLDISYNDMLLRDLYKILAKQYFLTTRRPKC